MLRAGGNAVDAAIAATAVQGMVAPETCGIGGDLFALVHRPGWDAPRALNASGRAGSGATPAKMRDSASGAIGRDDPLSVTVPGCVDGWSTLSQELGRLPLADCLAPAISHGSDGFEVSTEQAARFGQEADVYARHPAVRELYPQGRVVTSGDRIRRPALAATLEAIADGGRAAFYQGTPGEDIVEELGGVITFEDLAGEHAEWVSPISCRIGGLTAWTIPPNSQGYLGLATLGVFEMMSPPDDPSHPDWWHFLIEAFRSVAWERDDLVADADDAPLPAALLLDSDRLRRAAATIDRARTGIWPRTGAPSSTAYLCVVDNEGMAVSIIQSNFAGPGSHFGARRSGFLLHNRGSGFTTTPGHPNEIQPGKRPRHTLSPTIWTDEAMTRLVLGTRGAALQPQIVAQVAARVVLAGVDVEAAQRAPRWTVADFGPFSEARLQIEPGVPHFALSDLRRRGHSIEEVAGPQSDWGPVSVIAIDPPDIAAAADPRVDTTRAVILPG
ncbi:MAG TPA: gamma-glutamyltransferase [Acidimicrobiia bacterium]|nr:gamma-glutamyltransferase [Acidimicrobiia bacterium]